DAARIVYSVRLYEYAKEDQRDRQDGETHHLHPLRPAHDGGDAGTRDFDEAKRQHQADELLDLFARSGYFEDETFRRRIDHAGPEGIRQAQRLDAVLALALDLDHCEFAFDRIAGKRHVDNVMHGHKSVELVLDLLDHHRRARRNDRDQRQVLPVLGFRNRQGLDVVSATSEQTDNARQHARLVIDQHRERVGFRFLRGWRRRIMACRGSVHHTITLPSSVMASSTLTPASPSNISL